MDVLQIAHRWLKSWNRNRDSKLTHLRGTFWVWLFSTNLQSFKLLGFHRNCQIFRIARAGWHPLLRGKSWIRPCSYVELSRNTQSWQRWQLSSLVCFLKKYAQKHILLKTLQLTKLNDGNLVENYCKKGEWQWRNASANHLGEMSFSCD